MKNICDADTVFQLDPFHRNKAIKKNIPYPQCASAIHEILDKEKHIRHGNAMPDYKFNDKKICGYFETDSFQSRWWIPCRDICDSRHLMSAKHEFRAAARSNKCKRSRNGTIIRGGSVRAKNIAINVVTEASFGEETYGKKRKY